MEFDLQTRLQWLDTNHIQYGQNVTVVEPSRVQAHGKSR